MVLSVQDPVLGVHVHGQLHDPWVSRMLFLDGSVFIGILRLVPVGMAFQEGHD